VLTACEEELGEAVTAVLPRAYGAEDAPQLRLVLTAGEARAIFLGSRLLGRPVEAILGGSSFIAAEHHTLNRWHRPYARAQEMVVVRVHLPPGQLTVAERQAARFGLRTETFLLACALELLREQARREPTRWAFAGIPPAQAPAWQEQDSSTLQLA
jgi:hypothetical protein